MYARVAAEHLAAPTLDDDASHRVVTSQDLFDLAIMPRDECMGLWSLLKEFQWEGLVMILKSCSADNSVSVTRWVCTIAAYLNDLDSVVQIVSQVG